MPDLPIAVSTGPNTRLCTDAARRLLAEQGREARVYEADGQGGRDLEADVLAGRIDGVLDLTLTELDGSAGADRLTAAAIRGIPQIIGIGGLPELTPEGNDRLGQEIAHKASASRGPTTILIPLLSVSPVLVRSLSHWISPNVRVRELDLHVNDPAFAAAAVAALNIGEQS